MASACPDGADRSLHPAIVPTEPPLSDLQALREAQRCLQCGGPYAPAPCMAACPAEVDVPRFIRKIVEGRPVDSACTILAANVLGGSCARVCPVEVLCEGACVLHKEGRRAVQIGRLQRYATDFVLGDQAARAPVEPPAPRRPESVGVVGAGPAGLACAAELARLGYPVTVYERRPLPGGLITFGIAPYKQLVDPVPAEVERIAALGVQFQFGVAVGEQISVEELRRRHRVIFLGVGLGADLPAKLEGEHLPGVWESLRFIEQLKLGRRPPIGARVAVIGGGNTAIDVAREAVRLGAHEVTLLYRRSEAQMPAYRHEIEAARSEGVRMLELTAPLRFVGAARLEAVRCIRMRLGAPDASGRPRPEPVPGSEFDFPVDTAILAIGQQPLSDLLARFGLELEGSALRVNGDYQTRIPEIFAGGDCINGGATVVEAVRDGKMAARAIDRHLRGLPKPTAPQPPPGRVERQGRVTVHAQGDYLLHTLPSLCKGCRLCVASCPTGLLRLDARNRIVVSDVNRCVFCGLCEVRCPDFAIWVVRGGVEPGPVGEPARTAATAPALVEAAP